LRSDEVWNCVKSIHILIQIEKLEKKDWKGKIAEIPVAITKPRRELLKRRRLAATSSSAAIHSDKNRIVLTRGAPHRLSAGAPRRPRGRSARSARFAQARDAWRRSPPRLAVRLVGHAPCARPTDGPTRRKAAIPPFTFPSPPRPLPRPLVGSLEWHRTLKRTPLCRRRQPAWPSGKCLSRKKSHVLPLKSCLPWRSHFRTGNYYKRYVIKVVPAW